MDDVYERGETIDRIIVALQLVREQWHIQTFYADPSEPAYILQCQRVGLPMVAARNDVLPGINSVQVAIRKGLTVAPSCTGLLSELPGYTWAPAKTGGFRERPVEVGDDACDALRYAIIALDASMATGFAALAGQSVGGIA